MVVEEDPDDTPKVKVGVYSETVKRIRVTVNFTEKCLALLVSN